MEVSEGGRFSFGEMTGAAAAAAAAMATVRGELELLAAMRRRWGAARRERRIFIHGDGTGGEMEAGVSGDERQGKVSEVIGASLCGSKCGFDTPIRVMLHGWMGSAGRPHLDANAV